MDKVIIISEGGAEALSAAMLAKLKLVHGEDLIIVASIKEAQDKGYIYHKHQYPEPTEPSDLLKCLPPIIDHQPLIRNTSPIDAVGKRNRFGKHKF